TVILIIAVALLKYSSGEPDPHAGWTLVRVLHGSNEPGNYWVGDVTERYRLGMIPREVAEADVAPLVPLVGNPRPYRGYLICAMESGPSPEGNWTPMPLKGLSRCKETYATCIFPAVDRRPDLPVYLICPWGVFRKQSEGNKPVLNWPKDIRDFSSGWAIVD